VLMAEALRNSAVMLRTRRMFIDLNLGGSRMMMISSQVDGGAS
jgi:hypothetical protein